MTVAHAKLPGLDREKILAVVVPVLRSHQVVGVELLWRGDRQGQVLQLTIERAGSTQSGSGVTVDLCAELSRDLSAALDVADLIGTHYHLEVGSPGLDRPLHLLDDYRRFSGQNAKLKLSEALDVEGFVGQRALRGTILGVVGDDAAASDASTSASEGAEPSPMAEISLKTERGIVAVRFANIESARLMFEWAPQPKGKKGAPKARKPHPKAGAQAEKQRGGQGDRSGEKQRDGRTPDGGRVDAAKEGTSGPDKQGTKSPEKRSK